MLEITELKEKEDINKLEILFKDIFNNFKIIDNIKNNPFTNYFVLKKNSEIIGFINYDIIYDRCELVNINIIDKYKGNGYGNKLMEYMINNVNKIVKNISLEVRKDNLIAINMYKKYNFIKKSIRKNYYNGIDAILMVKEI